MIESIGTYFKKGKKYNFYNILAFDLLYDFECIDTDYNYNLKEKILLIIKYISFEYLNRAK